MEHSTPSLLQPDRSHKSGRIGEDPTGIPNNLMPYITQVAVGKREKLSVFGDDYDTPDGTGVRDYIHVVDLAKGHLKALDYVKEHQGVEAINLGTGNGYSVLDMVRNFEQVNGVKVPYEIVGRRPGDIATCYSDPSKATGYWDGRRNWVWRICAGIPGIGSRGILTVITAYKNWR